jgi:subtilisin family serine protease
VKLSVRRIGGVVAALLALLSILIAAPARAVSVPVRSYIVVLNDDVANPAAVATRQTGALGGEITHVYSHALKGYSALLPVGSISRLASDRSVKFIELDSLMRADATQTGATWGIDRIDQRNRPTNGTFIYNSTGAGVKAYIIDTGINYTHQDFGGRAVLGTDMVSKAATCAVLVCFGGGAPGSGSNGGVDCNGHGTHVSGTVGGSTYGVAKQVTLVAVRVLGCDGSGPTADVIAGVDWVTGNHQAGQPAVANMSLGGGTNAALDTAVTNAINDGVAFAVAAGNGNALGTGVDACGTSPGRVPAAMTIGATDNTDTKATFSNYGNCVDWYAPGVNIVSDWMGSNTATNTISGTSMATPHVAGVAAQYLQTNPGASPQVTRDALFNLTTKGIVLLATVNNHLLFTNL